MRMWIERLTTSRVTQALELAARFAEERHKVLAENVANIDTPDYHTKRLDPEAFQSTLKEALQRAEDGGTRVLELRGEAQVSTTGDGRLTVRPQIRPADNILFHDGRNASLETLMTDVQQNALDYSLATRLLSKRFDELLTAIRGKST
jgi:flagellar basal-body rod protein FlgB